ncbi:hypothetical protein BpHYR1_036248 [Brachionus plicatilis]|uniref:Uncharacterized protein n=1 Tax=Brachionus plicatilis TaxID=10195 RepID=A0A3M7RGP0_BRAPC|nr:hypothetical protein BpHYR1_036248 [Brachionus plicatilis]
MNKKVVQIERLPAQFKYSSLPTVHRSGHKAILDLARTDKTNN